MSLDGYRLIFASPEVMYALAFGQPGVQTAVNILRDEIAQNLRLLGATKLSELTPAMVRFLSGRQPRSSPPRLANADSLMRWQVNARPLEQQIFDGPYLSPRHGKAKL